jgi:hypothetical protein
MAGVKVKADEKLAEPGLDCSMVMLDKQFKHRLVVSVRYFP